MRTKAIRYRQDPDSLEKRQELILSYLGLVRQIARRVGHFLPPGVERDDLVHAGILGLISSVDRFDPEKGVQFTTYAEHRIRGAILDYLRESDWTPRSLRQAAHRIEKTKRELALELGRSPESQELADRLQIPFDELAAIERELEGLKILSLHDPVQMAYEEKLEIIDVLDSGETMTSLDRTELQQFRERLAEAVKELPEKARIALSLYHVEGLTMKEVGEVLGVTESRISQIYSQSIRSLRNWLDRRGVEDPRRSVA